MSHFHPRFAQSHVKPKPEAAAPNGNMTMQIHCVYNVYSCQTLKGQVLPSPGTHLIGNRINANITMAHETPLDETSMWKDQMSLHRQTDL